VDNFVLLITSVIDAGGKNRDVIISSVKFSISVPKISGKNMTTSVVDTGCALRIANMSLNFRKIFKW
jgi:hypothetical protein